MVIRILPLGTQRSRERAESLLSVAPISFEKAKEMLIAVRRHLHERLPSEEQAGDVVSHIEAIRASLEVEKYCNNGSPPGDEFANFMSDFARAFPDWRNEYITINKILRTSIRDLGTNDERGGNVGQPSQHFQEQRTNRKPLLIFGLICTAAIVVFSTIASSPSIRFQMPLYYENHSTTLHDVKPEVITKEDVDTFTPQALNPHQELLAYENNTFSTQFEDWNRGVSIEVDIPQSFNLLKEKKSGTGFTWRTSDNANAVSLKIIEMEEGLTPRQVEELVDAGSLKGAVPETYIYRNSNHFRYDGGKVIGWITYAGADNSSLNGVMFNLFTYRHIVQLRCESKSKLDDYDDVDDRFNTLVKACKHIILKARFV